MHSRNKHFAGGEMLRTLDMVKRPAVNCLHVGI